MSDQTRLARLALEWQERAEKAEAEAERLQAELAEAQVDNKSLRDRLYYANADATRAETEQGVLEATVDRVREYAKEMRGYCSPSGIAAVYADQLEDVLNGAQSHGDGRTPQTQGACEGQETNEAPGGSQ